MAGRASKRSPIRIILFVLAGIIVLFVLAYGLRFKIAAWYIDGKSAVREVVVSEIAKRAEPDIERGLHMTIPQTVFSFLTGRRSEGQRERDALKDVIAFSETAFKNHWLRFRDVHDLSALNGFDLRGSELAVIWVRGGASDPLGGFRVDFAKGRGTDLLVNKKCAFFAELKRYVKERAGKN